MPPMISGKTLIGGILAGAMLLTLGTGQLVAHGDDATPGDTRGSADMGMMGEATPGAPGTMSADDLHEAMHGMMGTMHAAGTSERMHEAMGPDGDELMAQCATMMVMMTGMMGGGDMMGGQETMGASTPSPVSAP